MKTSETKVRLLAVERFICDNPQGVMVKQIIDYLCYQFNICVDRKTIYDDISILTLFYNIQKVRQSDNTTIFRIEEL